LLQGVGGALPNVDTSARARPLTRGLAALLAVVVALLPVGHAARADEASERPARPWLLGDWGGLRTRLVDQGLDFTFNYIGEAAYNASGGTASMAAYTGQFTAGITFDLQKLLGLHDATFQFSYTQRSGRDLGQDAQLATLQDVQEVFGHGQTVRLTEMWFEQHYFDRTVSWKAGRMTFGSEFGTFPCRVQNNTFCGSAPPNLLGNYLYTWPISQWATRLQYSLEGLGYVKVALYDHNPQYLGWTDKQLPVFFPNSKGALIPFEIAWLPTFRGGTLPGSYKLGGWYSSATARSVAVDGLGNPLPLPNLPGLNRRGLYGGYFSFQQQITRNASHNPHGGLGVFANGVIADSMTSLQDRQVTAGITWTGPFDSRPDDAIAFAAGVTRVSPNIAGVAAQLNAQGYGPLPAKNAEYVFELDYTVAVRPGLRVRPNLQYVLSDGGLSRNASIWVLGLKTLINF
jgi:porin